MPSITQRRIRLVNPGRRKVRKRNMSLKQLLHFGTKRQRTAAKSRLHKSRSKKRNTTKVTVRSNPTKRRRYTRTVARKRVVRRRKRNVGTILSVLPNPSKRRRRRKVTSKRRKNPTMARATRKQLAALRKARAARRVGGRRRRRANPGVRRHRRRSGPVMYSRRRRRSNPVARRRRSYGIVRHRRYRRNPGGITGGTTGRVLGVIGGATLTKLLVGFVPAQFTAGFLGYIAIGAVAVLQGKAVGKVTRNPSLGQDFVTGGLVYLAIKMLNDFIPSLGGNLGLSGGRGMGLLAPSSFYLPQVNQMNSMGQFVRPSAVPAPYVPAPAGMHGMGNVRRTGRVR